MEHDLEEIFTFGQNKMADFVIENSDESKHFYLNDELIGGWAGDTQDFFFVNNDEFQFLKESFEIRKRIEITRKRVENENKTKNISIKIKTKNHTINGETYQEMSEVFSKDSFGYLDGPEDPVHHLSFNKELQNLEDVVEAINEAKESFEDFPENSVFNIDGHEFAVLNEDKSYVISNNFPKELIDTYRSNKISQIKIDKNDNNKYTSEIQMRQDIPLFSPYIREDHFSSVCKEFDTMEDAVLATREQLKKNKQSFNDNFISFINNEKVNFNNQKQKNVKGIKIK